MPNNHVQSGVLKYTVSDHYLVYTILSFKKDTTPGKILHKKSYDKMDTGAFLNELMLSQLYNIVSLSDNVQDAWVKWSDQFNSIVNRHVSTKQIRVKNRPNPWLTPKILELIYKRDYTHRKAIKLKNSKMMAEYKHLRNEVVSNIRKSQQDYCKKKISPDNKPQNIWKAVNESLGKDKKSKLPNDISPDDWNSHFTSVGPKLAKKFTDSQNPT